MSSPDYWTANNRRDETPAERADRNFVELLQEFRVAQQGVQVLFAFLLTVPFATRFITLSVTQEWVYLSALLSAALGTVFFVTPVSLHRLLFRMGLKDQIVSASSKFALGGLLMLLVSMLSSVYLVSSVVFGVVAALVIVSLGFCSALFCWCLLPLHYRKLAREAR